MTAAAMVALAKRAAHEAYADDGDVAWNYGDTLNAFFDDPEVLVFAEGRHADAVMAAEITPENTASEEALTRALVESRITAEQGVDSWWFATLADHTRSGQREAEARESLLDALLSTTETPA